MQLYLTLTQVFNKSYTKHDK